MMISTKRRQGAGQPASALPCERREASRPHRRRAYASQGFLEPACELAHGQLAEILTGQRRFDGLLLVVLGTRRCDALLEILAKLNDPPVTALKGKLGSHFLHRKRELTRALD
jgi:hypothetical protein